MRFEIVDAAVDEAGRVEDAVTAMHHVIVEGNDHQGRIGDDAPELARVEGGEFDRLSSAKRPQARKHVVRA